MFKLVALALVLASSLGGIPDPTAAQDAEQPSLISVAHLINPRGFAFDSIGQPIIAEAGAGGDQAATEVVPGPTGPYTGGLTGRVSAGMQGCPEPVLNDLPSARGAGGEVIGPSAVAVIGDATYLLSAGGGAAHGNPDTPAGIYKIESGNPILLADLGAWLRENPVAHVPETDFDPDGSWYSMVADPDGASLWVVESNSEQVLQVTLDGQVTRMADLSAEDQVPTAIAVSGSNVYVGHLTSAPFAAGSATVIKLNQDGSAETVWTGLTMVTGLAVDKDGILYAAELSGGRDRPPFFVPGTGRIVRQTGPGSLEEIATQVPLPTALAFGPDDALYVSTPAIGADSGNGLLLRFDLTQALPIQLGGADLTPPSCNGAVQPTVIKLSDLGFDPPSITLQVGATVTWRNTGELDHSVVSAPESPLQFDSGDLKPGEEFTQLFDEPGSYPYVDGHFPDQGGTIEIVTSP